MNHQIYIVETNACLVDSGIAAVAILRRVRQFQGYAEGDELS